MEHRRTTAALTTSPHGLANDVSITTHTPSTHTHTSYHRTPFTTIHLLHHNLPAQPTAPPPDPPHDRLSPRPPPVSSPPPMHGCSKTVSSVRCFVIGFLLAAHLPSSRAHPGAPRAAGAPGPARGGGDLCARRASSDTLLATACSWTCRGMLQAWVGQIVTFFAYSPPSRPLGSLTPTQPGRVTDPTRGCPGPPWEAPQAECWLLRREPKPSA